MAVRKYISVTFCHQVPLQTLKDAISWSRICQ